MVLLEYEHVLLYLFDLHLECYFDHSFAFCFLEVPDALAQELYLELKVLVMFFVGIDLFAKALEENRAVRR